jgi:hypothetical protein
MGNLSRPRRYRDGPPLIGNASEYEKMLKEVGFEDVEVIEHKLPTNS